MSKKFNLYTYFGYNPEASLVENLWESLAIVIVMQLYSYERRKSENVVSDDIVSSPFGFIGFFRRFLVWHSQKILFIALFYALLSPISASGFVYLLGLAMFSTLPKASRIPSKAFLIYTGFLLMAEYLFQMWGKQAKIFPGQKHYNLVFLLGLRLYEPSFLGVEAGLRAKVLVIFACALQYNVFHWLEKLPSSLLNDRGSEEPCPLFVSKVDIFPAVSTPNGENEPLCDPGEPSTANLSGASSWPSFSPGLYHEPKVASNRSGAVDKSTKIYSFVYLWLSTKESHKWDGKRIVSLRNERFEMQKMTLKIYLKILDRKHVQYLRP